MDQEAEDLIRRNSCPLDLSFWKFQMVIGLNPALPVQTHE